MCVVVVVAWQAENGNYMNVFSKFYTISCAHEVSNIMLQFVEYYSRHHNPMLHTIAITIMHYYSTYSYNYMLDSAGINNSTWIDK